VVQGYRTLQMVKRCATLEMTTLQSKWERWSRNGFISSQGEIQ